MAAENTLSTVSIETLKCSEVKQTAAESIFNTVSMEILKCSDVKQTATDNILNTVSMEILVMAVTSSELLLKYFKYC